jgi:hypothetical protein
MKTWTNWKGLAVLAGVAGIGLYLVAPNLMVAALPLLLFAACPLAMLLMMKGMHGNQGEARGQRASQETDAGLTREEQITRMRWQQADLDDRIDALEQEEPRPARNGKDRKGY